ncbi:MAG: undecaprenyl-diphosphate phosphatase, partial [Acidimicrobiales bacterium]
GHTHLITKQFGWNTLVRSQTSSESFYLAFVVGLHVANALALLCFFWRDWLRIIKAFFATLPKRRADTSSERLAWLIITSSIPVGIIGLVLEHKLRTLLAKPLAAAIFLVVNGLILLGGERVRRQSARRERVAEGPGSGAAGGHGSGDPAGVSSAGVGPIGVGDRDETGRQRPRRRLETLAYREAGIIGVVQSLALIAGFSRDGLAMVAGLVRGLNHEDAAKFAFLLATPIILVAGIYKVPDLLGPNGNGVRGQVLAGSVVTFFASLLTVRYLSQYFKTKTLTPFGIYCLVFGVFMTVFVSVGA